MNIEYHKIYSPTLLRDMEFKVYGHAGKPVLIFPTAHARFFQYEDFGMVAALASFIEEGKIQLFTVDGIDHETWFAYDKHPDDRIKLHEKYEQYVMNEFVPYIIKRSKEANGRKKVGKILVSGCSMGAFHAANFFFRYPETFDVVIGLSGVYHTKFFFGDLMDDTIKAYSPLNYLSEVEDPAKLKSYRQNKIIFCCGQGAWEDIMQDHMRQLEQVLKAKKIPALIDFWGYDVNHDWPWWQKQMPYFLSSVL